MILPTIGELNRRASIQAVKTRPTASGKHENAQTPVWTCWAKVEVVGGSTYWNSVQTDEAVTHRIYVRQVSGKTRPQDLPRQIEIDCDGVRYRVKRVTDVNSAERFTMFECEVLYGGDV